ncbi:hypothetical protein [Micrococcus luteus]|uniref:hypothetical protein n=1 Tax=Micrococcus luteus TaxID=1270 RepID=UPI00214D969C|nr:hypothetical protein [Micrococcus luteus]
MPTTPRRPQPPHRTDASRSAGGFVSPWEHGSGLYRGMVLAGSALFLVGIVLSVVGSTTHRLPLSWTALAVLGAGVLMHLSAQLVRLRQAGRRQRGRADL